VNRIPAIVERLSHQVIYSIKKIAILDVVIITAGIILAIAIRYPLLSFSSHDYFYKIRV